MLFVCSSASGGTASIEGTVIGPNGMALTGSEIRAQRLDAKTSPVITRSDAKGRYTFGRLDAGNYIITAAARGGASSIAVKARADGRIRLDLDFRKAGAGRSTAARPAATPVDSGVTDLSRAQRSLGGNISGMSFPGH